MFRVYCILVFTLIIYDSKYNYINYFNHSRVLPYELRISSRFKNVTGKPLCATRFLFVF